MKGSTEWLSAGLKGKRIPIEGRITILADVFDALSSRRVYKEALPENEVLRILKEGRGVFFDPKSWFFSSTVSKRREKSRAATAIDRKISRNSGTWIRL